MRWQRWWSSSRAKVAACLVLALASLAPAGIAGAQGPAWETRADAVVVAPPSKGGATLLGVSIAGEPAGLPGRVRIVARDRGESLRIGWMVICAADASDPDSELFIRSGTSRFRARTVRTIQIPEHLDTADASCDVIAFAGSRRGGTARIQILVRE